MEKMTPAIDSEKGKYTTFEGSRTWEYLSIGTCVIFAFSIGTTIGWISPTIGKLLEPDSPVLFTLEDISTMVAAGPVGQLCAPLVSSYIVDRFGRRTTLLISGIPVIVSSALIMIATHVWMIHIARVIVGFSLCMCLCNSPMYIGEVASASRRGAATSLIGISINIGILFSYGICPYLSIPRVAGILMIIGIVFTMSFWFMPETPYFLAMVGKFEEAESSLQRIRGRMDVGEELEAIKQSMPTKGVDGRMQKCGNIKDLFRFRANRRAFSIAITLLIPHNFGGFLIIVMYGKLIFEVAGNAIPSDWAIIAIGVTLLISSIIAGLVVDRLGRVPMNLGSGVVAGFANLAIGAHLFAKEYMSYDVSQYSLVFLVAVLIQIFAFCCGLLSTQMVLLSEIFATEVKGIGICLFGAFGGIFAIIASKLYIAIAVTWGFGHSLPFLAAALIVWSATCVLVIITPETKGKSFQEIQRDLNK